MKVEYLKNCWYGMLQRCNNPKRPAYKYYGRRGIKVKWKTFEEFYKDMGHRPTPKHSIDRIDVEGNYCKENCRWATWEQQANNKRPRQYVYRPRKYVYRPRKSKN